MSLNLATTQRAQYLDNNGDPYSEGRVSFFSVGTTDLKNISADPVGLVSLPNPLILDIGGFVPVSGVFYDAGNYAVQVEFRTNPGGVIPEYADAYTIPNVPGSPSTGGTNSTLTYIESVESLANLTPNEFEYIYCFNYYANNIDNGGGWFRWAPASTAPTDLGMIFALTASVAVGRMLRMYSGNVLSSYYGATPDRGVNMGSRISQAATWAVANSETLELVSGKISIDGTANILACDVQIDAGFSFDRLTALQTSILRFDNCNVSVLQDTESIAFNNDLTHYVVFEGDKFIKLIPAWWGAVGNGTIDDFVAFSTASNSDGVLQIQGAYRVIGTMASPSLVLNKVRLIDAGYFINEIATITVNECTGTEAATRNFRSPIDTFSNYIFNFVGKAQWFLPPAPTDAQLVTLRDAVKSKYLIWDNPIEYTLPSPMTDAQSSFLNEIKFGTTLNFTYSARIGTIEAGNYRIFSSTSVAPTYTNMKVLATWFGLSPFSTDTENRVALEQAIETASEVDGIVDCGGASIEVDNSVVVATNSNEVTIVNLNGDVNGGANPFFDITDSTVIVRNSKFEGLTSDLDCVISIIDCRIVFNSSSQGFETLGTNITVTGTTIGYLGGLGYTGVIKLGSVATKATTKSVVFDGNTINGGRVEFTSGTSINTISDNNFNEIVQSVINVDNNYMTIFGGSYTSIVDNNFRGVSKASSTGNVTFIKFEGSGESIIGLICKNSYAYEIIVGGSGFFDHRVLGYADSGHEAIVKPMKLGSNKGRGTSLNGYVDSAGGTGVFTRVFDLIFPYYNKTYTQFGAPYFHILSACDGFTQSNNGLGFYTEGRGCIGTGGNVQVSLLCQLRANTGYSIEQIGQIYISVEITDQQFFNTAP